jgi:hypothetical protein
VLERAAVQTKSKNGRIRVVPRRRDPFVPEAKGDFVNGRVKCVVIQWPFQDTCLKLAESEDPPFLSVVKLRSDAR